MRVHELEKKAVRSRSPKNTLKVEACGKKLVRSDAEQQANMNKTSAQQCIMEADGLDLPSVNERTWTAMLVLRAKKNATQKIRCRFYVRHPCAAEGAPVDGRSRRRVIWAGVTALCMRSRKRAKVGGS